MALNLALTLDDHGGMAFCGKRQSADRVLSQYFADLNLGVLTVNAYTGKLLTEQGIRCRIVEDPFSEHDGLVFDENVPLDAGDVRFEKIVVCRWNRSYPTSLVFPSAVLNAYRLDSTDELVGSSHDKITVEVYVRV